MTEASTRVRQLHTKFRAPTSQPENFWQPDGNIQISAALPQSIALDTRTPLQWKTFCACPFNGENAYLTYVAELAKITAMFKDVMNRKNSDGTTVLKLFQNGSHIGPRRKETVKVCIMRGRCACRHAISLIFIIEVAPRF